MKHWNPDDNSSEVCGYDWSVDNAHHWIGNDQLEIFVCGIDLCRNHFVDLMFSCIGKSLNGDKSFAVKLCPTTNLVFVVFESFFPHTDATNRPKTTTHYITHYYMPTFYKTHHTKHILLSSTDIGQLHSMWHESYTRILGQLFLA